MVRSAGELQYIVELGVGGLADGPLQHPFNTFERLNYLKSRRLEWRDPHVEEIAVIPPLDRIHLWKLRFATLVRVSNRNPLILEYFDVVDVVRLDPSSVEQSGHSYNLDSQHTGFEFDPGQDLLVLFDRSPTLPWCVFSLIGWFGRIQSGSSSSVSFSLLSLNDGTPHPEAINNPLVVRCLGKSTREQTDNLAAVLWEEILAVQLFDGLAKFYFVNWRTGVVIAVSVLKISPFHTLNLLLEHASEEHVRSNPPPLPSQQHQVCPYRVRLSLVATTLHSLYLLVGPPRECIERTGPCSDLPLSRHVSQDRPSYVHPLKLSTSSF